MSRTWDQIVTDYESLATSLDGLNAEARSLADSGTEPPVVEPPPTDGDTIYVPPGESVQEALDSCAPGTTIEMDPGIEYPGRLTIRKACTLRTRGAIVSGRVTADDGETFALLSDGLEISPGVCDVQIELLKIGGKNLNDICEVGKDDSTQDSPEKQPDRITFDQCVIVGHPTDGAKRGIAAQGKNIHVLRCHIADIFRAGQDTQCVGGWNGDGPFLIDDCYLAAAGENVMFGGDQPAMGTCIPSDIEICNCLIEKPMAWKGSSYTVKNHIEFKSGRRIHIHHNEIRNMWPAGQPYSLVITPSQYGSNPDNTVEDYVFEHNTVSNVSNGFNILGHGQNQDDRPTATSQRITIRDNWFQISRKDLGGNGWFMMMGNGPREIKVENNTIQTDGPVYLQGNSPGQNDGTPGFVFKGNIVQNIGDYGTSLNYNGTDQKRGKYWREYFAPDGVMEGNAYAGDKSEFKTNFPDDLHVSTADAADLVVDGYGVGQFEGYGRRE
jgi:hypothetical protein